MTESLRPERAWLGVVSAEHARRAAEGGFIQLNHGKRYGVARLRAGDGFAIYSPTDRLGEKAPLRAFTALGVVADAEPYQAEPMSMGAHGIVRPWRRRVESAPPVGRRCRGSAPADRRSHGAARCAR